MKTFFQIVLFLLLSGSFLCAQKPRRGENRTYHTRHVCVGRIYCNGIHRVDARLKALFHRLSSPAIVYPKILDKAVLSHKDFKKYFDLTKPMVAFYMISGCRRGYWRESRSKDMTAGWVFGVSNRREIDKKYIEIAGVKFWTNYHNKMLYLSTNKNLLHSSEGVPDVKKIRNCDIRFNLRCARFAKWNPDAYDDFENYMFENWFKKTMPSEVFAKSSQVVTLQREAFKDFLKQAEELTIDMDIRPNELRMEARFTPLENSLLENFIQQQKKYRGSPPSVPAGKFFCLSGAVEPYYPYIEMIQKLITKALELKKTDMAKKYAEYLNYCIGNFDGRFNYLVDKPGDSMSICNLRLTASSYVDMKSKLREDSSCKQLGKNFYSFYFDPLDKDSKSEFFHCCYGRNTSLVTGVGPGRNFNEKSLSKYGRTRQVTVPGRSFLYALFCDENKKTAELSAGLDRSSHIVFDISLYEPLLRRVFPKESKGGKKPVSDLVKILRNL